MLPDIVLVPWGATGSLPEDHLSVGMKGDSRTHHVEKPARQKQFLLAYTVWHAGSVGLSPQSVSFSTRSKALRAH